MKKTFRTILAGAVALLAVSCYDDSELRGEISGVKERLDAIEATLEAEVGGISDLISRIESLEGKIAAIKVETKDGVTTLTLSNESSVVLSKNGVLTIQNGNWATVAADGTVTPLPYKVSHELDFKVEGGELKVSYDGTTYEATGVKVSEYTAHVIGNVVKAEDGKSVTVTIGDQTLQIPLVSSAVATLGLSTDSFFLRYGASKEVEITATDLTDVYVVNQPDGWRASIEGDVLSIIAPTKKAAAADAAVEEGLILIHAKVGKECVFAQLEVEAGEGLTIKVDDEGNVEIRNAYTGLQKNEMLGTEEFGFMPFHFGIMSASDYMQMTQAGYTIESFWLEKGYAYGATYLPYNVFEKGIYVENEYEVDVIKTTVGDLLYPMTYSTEVSYGSYVLWVASDNGKGFPADGVISVDYTKMLLEVEVVEVTHNDVKIKVTAMGADGYVIGAVAQSNYLEGRQVMTFDEYMQNASQMGSGPWAEFKEYGEFSPLGLMFTEFSEDQTIELSTCWVQNRTQNTKFDFEQSYDFWVMPVFAHLIKQGESGYDFSAFDYQKHFKPYVQHVTTKPLVEGEVAAPTVTTSSTYYEVSAEITPAEGTTVYYAFVDSETNLSLETPQACFDYLLEECMCPLTEKESCDETVREPGESRILLTATVADGKYSVARQTLTSLALPSVKNAELSVVISDEVTAIDMVSATVTPSEGTSVYCEFMSESLFGSLSDEAAFVAYLCKKNSITEAKSFEKTGLGSGGKTTLAVLVVDAENNYNLITKEYLSETISYDENLTVTLEEKSWTNHYPVLKFKVSGGATKVAVSFLSASEYSKGQAELYAAANNIYNATFIDVDANGYATLSGVYDNYRNNAYATAIKVVDGNTVVGYATPFAKQ